MLTRPSFLIRRSFVQQQEQYTRAISTCNQAIDNVRLHNDRVNAFVAVEEHRTLQDLGNQSAQRQNQGTSLGPLDGAPIGIKDNFCTKTLPTTCGSRILEGFTSPYDATVVQRLRKAGAIIMGKTNMDEFGMGAANIFSHYGTAVNPHDKTNHDGIKRRVAGGSSGGSAAAVASGMCIAALGSDTGGSVRLPASYCGVVGYKPSYGRCSRHGLVTYANSLDTVGILAQDVSSARLVYDAISSYDAQDPTSMPDTFRKRIDVADQELALRWSPSTADDLSGLVVGVPQEYYVDPLSAAVVDIWRDGIRFFEERGASIVPVSLPMTRFALPAYFTIALAEASSNLARYDGVRYGRRSKAVLKQEDGFLYADTRAEGFGSEVKRRIMLGTHLLTAGTYDKTFLPAQKARRLVQQDFDGVFSQANVLQKSSGMQQMDGGVHVLLTPCAMSPAPTIEDCLPDSDNKDGTIEKHNGAVDTYVNDVMTIPASLAGIPAISVPFGQSEGFPVGLQLLSQYGYDQFLLKMAEILTIATK
ncbi:amidase signature domain-containing protein [Zychaea mexicana]|uniref:amidase signature domain-containing protein n=1 Tax=Zychaea mexicana TaxID=64656 RepID=UPI0022FE9BCE|nr:amidase signature domain-containing protein [Zychaea mexicana]KAI9490033.1 amidase signature domain-containing protein [Zychaea mexicana]